MNPATSLMRVFHRTGLRAAEAILRDGFRDATGTYLTDQEFTGVWVSTAPLTGQEGAGGDTLLSLKIPAALFEEFEWREEGVPYREALIPADRLNAHGPARRVTDVAEARWMERRLREPN